MKWSEFINKSYLASKAFYSLGLQENDFCAIYLPNSTEFHVIALGAWLCGSTISPADYSLTAKGMTYQLEEIKPKMIVCCDANKDKVIEAVKATGLDNYTRILILSLIYETEDKDKNLFTYSKLMKEAETFPKIPSYGHDTF